MRNTIDRAIGDGLRLRARYDEEVPVAQSLHDAYPSSAAGLTALGNALMLSGRREEVIKLAAAVKQDSLAAPAARLIARAHELGQEYTEAVQTLRDLCSAKKCVANDWNTLAWLTLFAPGKVVPDAKGAETAVRMTQDRNVAYVHTLASIQAENGQFKDARAGLLRYQGTNLTISDSAWYLQARIAEGLGLNNTAKAIYSKIAKPQHPTGDGAYDLSQIRLKLLGVETLP